MSFPTTDAQGELQAVNQILASVGQAPVTTLEQTNPDVAIAYNTLQQVSREVQAEGWTFNKEYHYPLTPDEDGEFKIPNNMLQIDLCMDEYYNKDKDPIRRDGKLYDRNSHSFKWDKEKTHYFDITWLFDWADLPTPIQDYITARSSTLVAMRIIGDPALYQTLQQQEVLSRATAIEYETQQGDYTFFGHPQGGNYYNSYKPYHALYR